VTGLGELSPFGKLFYIMDFFYEKYITSPNIGGSFSTIKSDVGIYFDQKNGSLSHFLGEFHFRNSRVTLVLTNKAFERKMASAQKNSDNLPETIQKKTKKMFDENRALVGRLL
jgi:hypothetical protein